MLRAADAEVDPFAFKTLADRVNQHLSELKKLHADAREHAAQSNLLLDSNAFRLAADPTQGFADPPRAGAVPALDFAPLDAAAARLSASAAAYDSALAAGARLDAGKRARLNALLQSVEQTLTDPDGLPNRGWYKNLLYAPGALTGYGAKTVPGVREAIEGERWSEAQAYIARTGRALDLCASRLDAARALLP